MIYANFYFRNLGSKEFVGNQKKIYDLALNERVVIKRGKNIFFLTCGNFENDKTDDDYADLIEAKAYANDEDTSLADFKKYVSELNLMITDLCFTTTKKQKRRM